VVGSVDSVVGRSIVGVVSWGVVGGVVGGERNGGVGEVDAVGLHVIRDILVGRNPRRRWLW
jgi:hypothetical protein